jgi:hypothetical protein
MKKLFLLACMGAILFGAKAQLIVNLQLPPVALTLKNQLWSMTLINTGGQVLTIKTDITVTDVANNMLVLSASSAEYMLAAGTRQMQSSDFMPLVYNVNSANYTIDNNPNGFLPVGNFMICYQFSKITGDNVEMIAEECETIEVEPLSPPLLVFPEDDAVLESTRPVFNWIPPTPFNLFSNLSYDFRLVEVGSMQVASDAIQQNIAVYAQQNIATQVTIYPAGLPALDTGKVYAWQVTAKSNNSFVAKSDVWVFKIGQFGSEGQVYNSGESFAKLKMSGNINYFLCKGKLRFYYDNYLNDDTVQLAIYDMAELQTPLPLDSNYLRLQPGQNLKEIDILTKNEFRDDHLYHLVLTNSHNEKWIVKFYYKKEEIIDPTPVTTN